MKKIFLIFIFLLPLGLFALVTNLILQWFDWKLLVVFLIWTWANDTMDTLVKILKDERS